MKILEFFDGVRAIFESSDVDDDGGSRSLICTLALMRLSERCCARFSLC